LSTTRTFTKSKTYQLTVSDSIEDTFGNSLAAAKKIIFHTELDPTWESSAKEVFMNRCVQCHANFKDRDSVLASKEKINSRVKSGSMPPGGMPILDQNSIVDWILGATN
jgi:hypothetical protein